MSGHSKFANIKHKKEKNDAAKGKIFTMIGREIFGTHDFSRETKEKLFDPKQVLDLIYRGTKESGFELSQEKIDSVINNKQQYAAKHPLF